MKYFHESSSITFLRNIFFVRGTVFLLFIVATELYHSLILILPRFYVNAFKVWKPHFRFCERESH